ncbi:hypothetical protein, partial [Bacteroides heparinolyticus]|uniref:hypothetical protein n=1 Tax=Prevotella heparinolytica TaxID=28113 RepID=UPI0035A14FED
YKIYTSADGTDLRGMAEIIIAKHRNGAVGDVRLRFIGHYTRTNLTTQGIGIIFKKDFSRWKELLFWNKWKLRRLKKKQKTASKESLPVANKDTASGQLPQAPPEAQSKRNREE